MAKATAKKNSAFMKPVQPSEHLAKIVGTAPLPRTEVKAAATRAPKKEEAALTQPVQVQEPPAPEPQVQATPETTIPE